MCIILRMIWIHLLPIPPSANKMHSVGSNKVWRQRKNGEKYMGTSAHVYNSPELTHFYLQCKNFANINYVQMAGIRKQLLDWISKGYVLKTEAWVGFENGRVWTKEGQPQQVDSDNRLKPLQDGLSKMLDLDDKWIFSATIEKVTVASKDLESCSVRIMPIKPRTMDEVRQLK